MTEIFDFGRHAPYIMAAYSVSVIVIVALIIWRRNQLKKSREHEQLIRDKN